MALLAWWKEVVRSKPDAPAALITSPTSPSSSTTITFRDLDRSSDALAGFLLVAGLVPFDRVGIDFHPSQPAELVALLALVKCGAIAVPVRSFRDEIVADAGLRIALVPRCDGEEAASLSASLPILRLGPRGEVDADDAAALAPLPPSAPPRCNLIGALSILYTSGSTGPPKGVVGRENGFLHRIQGMHQAFPFAEGQEEVVLRRTPLTFVDSVWEIWGALLAGVPLLLHTAALEKKQDPAFFPCPGVTRATLTPSLLAALLQCDAPILRAGSSLRFCLCSGEALSWALAKQLLARLPSCTLIHLYGSTEVSGDATWTTLTKEDDEKEASTPISDTVPLGEPLPGTRLWVVEDGTGRKVQVGEEDVGEVDVEGELWVAGPGVALGYYGAEEDELNAKFGRVEGEDEAFLPLFKTGDWVHYVFVPESRRRKDGSEKQQSYTLTFRGRRDSLVKVRGVRVGLEEAERRTALALGLGPSGGGVGMMVVPGPCKSVKEDAVLLLALTWEAAMRFSHIAQLRERLREGGLPAEMMPSQIVVGVTGQPLPLTSSGKMDRQQLARWGQPLESHGVGEVTEPSAKEEDDVEQWLEECFARLVGRQQHSEGQKGLGLFDRGGHSLLAMQALSEIEARFGKVSAGLMVEDLARTVPNLARLLSGAQHSGNMKKRMRSDESKGDEIQGLRLTERWRFAFEKCVDAHPCLVWVGSTEGWWVLIGAHDHSFAALDLMTGKELWRTRVEGRIEGGATVQGPLVFIPSHDFRLYAYFLLTGKLAWSCRTGGEIKGAPLPFCLAGPADTEKTLLVAFGSYDGHLYIVDASSGALWAAPSPLGGSPFASPLLLPAAAGAAAARLVTVTNRGRVAQWQVQRQADGRGRVTLDWSQEVGCAVFTTPIFSSASSLLVLGGTDGSALALNPSLGGAVVWRVALNGGNGVGAAPIFASPCLLPADNNDDDHEEGVLFACQSSLNCLASKSGERKWLLDTSAKEGETITGKPTVLEGSRSVLVSTSLGRVLVLNVQKERTRTEVIATLSVGDSQRLSSPAVVVPAERLAGGKKFWLAVVGSRDDGVYMVEIEET